MNNVPVIRSKSSFLREQACTPHYALSKILFFPLWLSVVTLWAAGIFVHTDKEQVWVKEPHLISNSFALISVSDSGVNC